MFNSICVRIALMFGFQLEIYKYMYMRIQYMRTIRHILNINIVTRHRNMFRLAAHI